MITALLVSFGVIFVAELGDKSQLMAMTYALKYRWWVVLAGITIATTLVHAVSVGLGHFLGMSIPSDLLSIVGGLAMLVFGLWTVRGDTLDDDESSKAERLNTSVLFAVIASFFLAELGDKTMLATITLSTDNNWLGVWIGSTIGMVAADALAIGVGALLGRRLPEQTIAYGAAALFFVFAAWLTIDGLVAADDLTTTLATTSIATMITVVGIGLIRARREEARALAEKAAQGDEEPADRPVTNVAD